MYKVTVSVINHVLKHLNCHHKLSLFYSVRVATVSCNCFNIYDISTCFLWSVLCCLIMFLACSLLFFLVIGRDRQCKNETKQFFFISIFVSGGRLLFFCHDCAHIGMLIYLVVGLFLLNNASERKEIWLAKNFLAASPYRRLELIVSSTWFQIPKVKDLAQKWRKFLMYSKILYINLVNYILSIISSAVIFQPYNWRRVDSPYREFGIIQKFSGPQLQ